MAVSLNISRLGLALLCTSAVSCSAFTPSSNRFNRIATTSASTHPSSAIFSQVADVPSDVEDVTPQLPSGVVTSARDEVLYLAKSLSEESLTGIFISNPVARSKLNKAVAELEAVAPGPFTERDRELTIGDWELVCTARGPSTKSSSSSSAPKTPKLPFNLKPPSPGMVQDKIRKSVTVTQKVRASSTPEGEDENPSNVIDRVDHIIEYTPLTLKDIISEDSPLKAVRDWNVNPLEVSRSKVTLIHDASVESLTPVFRTKIGLKSVVVTVAGTSQYLEPEGADILGVNIPQIRDFLNAGTFDTAYVDENIRISRGKIGNVIDDLRVFVRKGVSIEDIMEDQYESVKLSEEEEDVIVDERLEKVSDAVKGVATSIEKLDKDVRTTVEKDVKEVGKAVEGVRDSIQDAAKEVQEIVEEDLKVIGKSVDEFRSAVVEGVVTSDKTDEKTSDDDALVVEAVAEDVEEEEGNSEDDEDSEIDTSKTKM